MPSAAATWQALFPSDLQYPNGCIFLPPPHPLQGTPGGSGLTASAEGMESEGADVGEVE